MPRAPITAMSRAIDEKIKLQTSDVEPVCPRYTTI